MTEPIAWRAKDIDDDEYQIYDYKPLYFDIIEPLYALEQLHPRMTMSQSEFNEWKDLYGRNEDGSGNVFFALNKVIQESSIYPNLNRMIITPTRYQDNLSQSLFADLWVAYNPESPEESINIVPDKKWLVRSKEKNGSKYLYLKNLDGFVTPWYTLLEDNAQQFNTKEEAEKWTNPLTEAVHLIV